MKQDYLRPVGRLVAMGVRENIAASGGLPGGPGVSNSYGVTYRQEGDTLYISNSAYTASSTGSNSFDSFYDLVTSYVYDLNTVCRT